MKSLSVSGSLHGLYFFFFFEHRTYLDLDISLSGEEAQRCTQKAMVMFLSAINSLKELFFVKSLFESLKVSQLQALVLM